MNFGYIAILAALLVIAYWGANTFFKARASKELMEEETPFVLESADSTKTLLVLGDSTGVGVGADTKEDTVAGRLASYIGATAVENYAKTGAAVADLPQQIAQAKRESYDFILIQVGGNDILAFNDAKQVAAELGGLIDTLPKANKILLMSAGNVGGATLFPHPIRPFYTLTTKAYHREFGKMAQGKGVTYVNLYVPPESDPFIQNPTYYLAADGLHPSSPGYELWFEKLRESL